MKKFHREPRNISRYFGGGVTEGEEEQEWGNNYKKENKN
jgi:hypothetical protein